MTAEPDVRRSVAAATAGATFLAFLDVTVVNLAFPALRDDFRGASLTDLSWVITAYTVALAGLLAPFGRVADAVGRRRLFVGGVAVFALSSAAAAVAPDLGALIAARAVQGAASAAMIPTSLSLLLANTPAEGRARAIGLWGASGALAASIGPSLGGVIVEPFGWRAVFVINVPVAAVILLASRRIPADRIVGGRLPDPFGTALLASGIALLVLSISQAPEWGWVDVRTAGASLGGAAAVCASVLRSRTHPAPAMQVSLWRNRQYAATNAVSLLYGAALFAWMLIGVVFLVQVWGYGELRAGFAMSPAALSGTVAALAGARLVDAYGQRAVAVAGTAVMAAAGVIVMFALGPDPAFLSVWLPTGLAAGAGMGLATTALSSAAAVSVEPAEFASALGLNMTSRQLGGALGIAGLAAYLQSRAPAEPLGAFTESYGLLGLVAAVAAVAAMGLPRLRRADASAAPPEPTRRR